MKIDSSEGATGIFIHKIKKNTFTFTAFDRHQFDDNQ
jgi:hypothetical protein